MLVDDGEAGRFGEYPRRGVDIRQQGGQGGHRDRLRVPTRVCDRHGWIAPLAMGWHELGELNLERLCCFDTALRELLLRFLIDAGVQPTLRSEQLLRIRHELAASGHLAVAVPGCDGPSQLPRPAAGYRRHVPYGRDQLYGPVVNQPGGAGPPTSTVRPTWTCSTGT